MKNKLPNTIIIGAQKAGTSSLFDWLGQHPEIYAPPSIKDFPFFNRDRYFNRGFNFLANFYENFKDEKILLHGYVNYIFFSEKSAKRLYEFNKDLKLILVLRCPVERAYSAFKYALKVGIEDNEDFENIIFDKRKNIIENSYRTKSLLSYLEHGFYYDQLQNYHKYFNKNQIKIIFFENMIKHKNSEIKKIFKFLDVDEKFIPNFKHLNNQGKPRSKFIQKLLSTKIPYFRKLVNIIPLKNRILIKNKLKKINSKQIKYPVMKQDLRKKLIDFYKDDVNKLQSYLEINLNDIWLKK